LVLVGGRWGRLDTVQACARAYAQASGPVVSGGMAAPILAAGSTVARR